MGFQMMRNETTFRTVGHALFLAFSSSVLILSLSQIKHLKEIAVWNALVLCRGGGNRVVLG